MRPSIPRSAVVLTGSLAAIGAAGLGAVLAQADRPRTVEKAPLVFGIYPGGAAGTVGPSGPVKPEDPVKRLAALQRLRPAKAPFVVRLYAAYLDPGGPSAAQDVGGEVASYTRAGLDVELVLTYRPQTGGTAADVRGFSAFARDAVRAFGVSRRFVSLQVTNEANVGGAPNVADGSYTHVRDALVSGVVAAKQESRRRGFTQIKVGFNWAYVTDAGDRTFWRDLGTRGGRTFVADLDWVGFDVYPGTWGPALHGQGLRADTARTIDNALRRLRANLTVAGIPTTIPLHVSESGYPTGSGRTDGMQSESMKASIAAVESARRAYNITNFTWFDLRDADSSGHNFQTQYGILRDNYAPKPAFAVYQSLIARLSKR
jgi:hypothetical protein